MKVEIEIDDILEMLRDQELTTTILSRQLHVSECTVRNFMRGLVNEGMVGIRKEGKNKFYHIRPFPESTQGRIIHRINDPKRHEKLKEIARSQGTKRSGYTGIKSGFAMFDGL